MQPRSLTDGHTVGHQNQQSPSTLRKLTSDIGKLDPKFWEFNLEFVQQLKEQSLQPDVFFCASSSASLGRVRYWQLALAQLDLLGSNSPDMICFNAVSSSAVNASAWPFACKILETAMCRALEPSTETFRSLMGSALSSSDWPLALQMLSDISAKRASTISAHISPAIDACGSAMWPAALHLFDSMKLFGVTFTASHEGIVKVLGLNWAMSLQVTMHVPDCLADAALYRQALLSCLRSGELMQALRLLERCRSHGIQSTLAMRGAFLAACEDHGSLWQEALLVYHHSFAINSIDGTMSNSLLCMCRAHRQWQWSHRLFSSSACSAKASASAYISSMGHVRQWESATDALAMLRTGMCQRLGSLGDADWDAAIKSIGNAGANWRGSLQLLQGRLGKHRGTRYGFSAAMGVSQQGQQWIHAAQLLMQMQQGDLVPNAISYSTVAAAVQEFRHWESTVNMLHLAPRGDSNCHCLNALISCCEKARAWRFALQSIGHMQVIRLMPDGVTFSSGIAACEKGLKWSFALHLLDQNYNPRPLDTERSIQGSAALSAVARSSNWQMAMAVVSEVVDPKRPEVLTVSSALLALNSKEASAYELRKARGWLNHVAAEAVSTNLDQTPRVRHRAAYMAAELLDEHDALSSSVAACIAACISRNSQLAQLFKFKRSKLTLEIWPPVPSWELRKHLEGWLPHDLQTEQPSWSTRRWLVSAKVLARRQSQISSFGHEVFAELVACSTMASLPCYISTPSGARDKRHCQFQAGHSAKLTGHRSEDGESGRLLIAVEGEGRREPHAERQALLDILCTLVELEKENSIQNRQN